MNDKRIATAKSLAKQAGELLLEVFLSSSFNKNIKGKKDIVTDADIKAEDLIKKKLLEEFPEDNVVSEEKDSSLEHARNDFSGFWVIDPLDGTRNFSIGNPNFVVSIGYVDGKDDLYGVIYYPILKQLFYTSKEIAFMNNRVLHVGENQNLTDSVVAFWDKREKDPDWDRPDILNLLRGKVKVLRIFGASALEKSWVASGQIDLYIGNSSSIFGAVAGVSLVRKAGGVALNLDGDNWELGDIGIICGNKVLVEKAINYLK